MPEGQERTEKATPRKRGKERSKGNVARSAELNSVAILFAGIFLLSILGKSLIDRTLRFMVEIYQASSFIEITDDSIINQVFFLLKYIGPLVGAFLLGVVITGLGINYLQIGYVFAKDALKPKFNKLNPVNGLKKLFSPQSLVELAKGLLKFIIVGYIAYSVLKKHTDEYLLLYNVTVTRALSFLGSVVFELTIKIAILLLILAVADFFYQRYMYEKRIMMTKQEVKDEWKDYEGDPRVKSRIRSMQLQMARRRMMSAVPEATVVVTNPVFIAVALKYEPVKRTDAPVVVAKGKRKIAEKIKKIAIENDVPVVENKPLARSLFETCEIGMEIPVALYQAVAEVLAYVYQIKKDKNPLMRELQNA